MKLPDINLLLYAYDLDSARQSAAREWLEETLSGAETVAFPWAVIVGFVRISTNPATFKRPRDASELFGTKR